MRIKTKVQSLRENKNLTQTELAEKSKLSIRTIQRIEAGNIPKGFTLKSLAQALDTDSKNLLKDFENDAIFNRARLINLSALSALIIPFGNLIIPAFLTYNSKNEIAKNIGKNILGIQIIYTLILSALLIISPFIQKMLVLKIPLFIFILIVMNSFNAYIIIKNGQSLTNSRKLYISLNYSIL